VLFCVWSALALILSAGGFYSKVAGLVLMVSLAIIVAFAQFEFLLPFWLYDGSGQCYSSSGGQIATCMQNCANYFGSFQTNPQARPRDYDPTLIPGSGTVAWSDFWGLCSFEALTFRFVIYALLPAFSMLACVAMGHGLLGASAPQSAEPVKEAPTCQNCGARMKPEARFCVMCGTPTAAPPAATSNSASSEPANASDADPKSVEMASRPTSNTIGVETITERGPDGIWRERVVTGPK